MLAKVPGFDVELGRLKGLGNFEDTLFSWQLLAAGYKLVGALDVAVEHHFDLTRWTGRTCCMQRVKWGAPRLRLLSLETSEVASGGSLVDAVSSAPLLEALF